MHKSIKALSAQCCNLLDGSYCIRKDGKCSIMEGIRCKYFEESVLPANKQLEALYYKEFEEKDNGGVLSDAKKKAILAEHSNEKQCICCKKSFKPLNNKQKYCKECGPIERRERVKANVQKLRASRNHLA